ncbi:retron system putative HNH endonuclease [Bacillus sp. B190/17]|uniref:Retron system putative HNH endonuclease n=1 Tax=Bacillus lumedeiriae TaxID=3058829 RepID=A0ABW8ICC0_9BACI
MRKVKRTNTPDSLKVNGNTWTQELLSQVKDKGKFSKVTDSYKNKYNQQDVRSALEKMYKAKCCYCEYGIGTASYEHIEHLKPKADPRFHHLIYSWNNLHWCCQKCNMAKGNKWNDGNPIIDPAIEDPADFIEFDVITGEIVAKSGRGKTTIEHADLNRESLVKSRNRIKEQVMKLIVQTKLTPSPKDEIFYKDYIMEFANEEADYSSYIKQLINTYL